MSRILPDGRESSLHNCAAVRPRLLVPSRAGLFCIGGEGSALLWRQVFDAKNRRGVEAALLEKHPDDQDDRHRPADNNGCPKPDISPHALHIRDDIKISYRSVRGAEPRLSGQVNYGV